MTTCDEKWSFKLPSIVIEDALDRKVHVKVDVASSFLEIAYDAGGRSFSLAKPLNASDGLYPVTVTLLNEHKTLQNTYVIKFLIHCSEDDERVGDQWDERESLNDTFIPRWDAEAPVL